MSDVCSVTLAKADDPLERGERSGATGHAAGVERGLATRRKRRASDQAFQYLDMRCPSGVRFQAGEQYNNVLG
jgi:hypothetical protein